MGGGGVDVQLIKIKLSPPLFLWQSNSPPSSSLSLSLSLCEWYHQVSNVATTSSMCSHISEQRITYASSIPIPLPSLLCFPLLSSTWHQPTIVPRTSPEDERVRLGLFDSILTVYRCFPFSFFLVSFSAYMFLCLLQRLASVFGFLYGSRRVRYSPLLLLYSSFPSCVDICPSEGSDRMYILWRRWREDNSAVDEIQQAAVQSKVVGCFSVCCWWLWLFMCSIMSAHGQIL